MECTGQNQGRQEETHHPIHRFGACSPTCFKWDEYDVLAHPSVLAQNHFVINLCLTTYAVEQILVSIISNSEILLSLQWNVFATVNRGGIVARIHRWPVMIYGSLQAALMATKYNGHIHRYETPVFGNFFVYIYLNWFTLTIQYFWGCKI